jgi:hypothetical protein
VQRVLSAERIFSLTSVSPRRVWTKTLEECDVMIAVIPGTNFILVHNHSKDTLRVVDRESNVESASVSFRRMCYVVFEDPALFAHRVAFVCGGGGEPWCAFLLLVTSELSITDGLVFKVR